jgi:ribosomal protein S17
MRQEKSATSELVKRRVSVRSNFKAKNLQVKRGDVMEIEKM